MKQNVFSYVINTTPALRELRVMIIAVFTLIPTPGNKLTCLVLYLVLFPFLHSMCYYYYYYYCYSLLFASRLKVPFKSGRVFCILMLLKECFMPNWCSIMLY